MLHAVTDIMQSREYAEFADRVLASHDSFCVLDINQAHLEVLNGEEDPVEEVVAVPALTPAAANHSQLSSKLYFVSLAHSTRHCQHCCTVTALPFASLAAFCQPDDLAGIRQL